MIVRFFRLLGTVLFSCCDHDSDWDRLQSNRRATQNRYYHYQYDNDNESDHLQINGRANLKRQNYRQYEDDSIKANLLAPSPTAVQSSVDSSNSSKRSSQSKIESNASKISPFSKLDSSFEHTIVIGQFDINLKKSVGSDASDISLLFPLNPTPKVVSGRMQIKPPFEQPDVKLNISTSSFPSKSVSSSSPQRPGAVSFVQSDIKSNTLTSSFSTKNVQSSSPLRPDATSSGSNNFITKPATGSSMQYVVKSNSLKNSQASKPIPAVSPTPKAASSPGSNNFITKPATGSSMQYVVKSNSLKNAQASKPIPAVSPTPKATSSPIYSTRQTITSPFVRSNAGLNASIMSASSEAGPGLSEIEDSKEVGKGGTQRYEIPKQIEEMIKKGIVPPVLKMPLSPDTYADYFAALLYAEDFYCEKWSDYLLEDVTLKLQDQSDNKKSKNGSDSKTKTRKNYPFVVFEIKEVRERRPFLLSRDHVHLRPVGKGRDFEPFHGVICVAKSTTILAEFKDDFHKQHKPLKRYDVSFSFNRVSLKRAHRAVSAATNPLLRKILFPNLDSLPTQWSQVSPMNQILNYKLAPIPYLIEGPLLSRSTDMLILIKDIVLKIYESCKESRVLICAPKNSTCDELVSLIMEKVSEYDIFRANAAFRDKELVPDDIMPACIFRRECFTCPPLDELERFRIITSTFVSTFRLYNAGLKAGHFSHIFLLDASSAIEPETIVALVDLVSEDTVVVVTGSVQNQPYWVRSDIGRNHGLKKSFFERLRQSEPYWSDNPLLITHIGAF